MVFLKEGVNVQFHTVCLQSFRTDFLKEYYLHYLMTTAVTDYYHV